MIQLLMADLKTNEAHAFYWRMTVVDMTRISYNHWRCLLEIVIYSSQLLISNGGHVFLWTGKFLTESLALT